MAKSQGFGSISEQQRSDSALVASGIHSSHDALNALRSRKTLANDDVVEHIRTRYGRMPDIERRLAERTES
jgi:hypothetical protein